MALRVVIVDAFTRAARRGNSAAVCLLEKHHDLSDSTMQSIAREMNLSETAFLKRAESAKSASSKAKNTSFYDLRWFTPTTEVNLCGHATLAATHALVHSFGDLSDKFDFNTKSGHLIVTKAKSKSINYPDYSMDFPKGNPLPVQLQKSLQDAILNAFSLPLDCVDDVAYCDTTKKLLLKVKGVEIVWNANCNPNALLALKRPSNLQFKGIIITSNVNDSYKPSSPPPPTYDLNLRQTNTEIDSILRQNHVVCRYFAPWNGINEDPVTGSAHTVLAVYWSLLISLRANQFIKSYQASARGGSVFMRLIQSQSRVELAGSAVTTLKGELLNVEGGGGGGGGGGEGGDDGRDAKKRKRLTEYASSL